MIKASQVPVIELTDLFNVGSTATLNITISKNDQPNADSNSKTDSNLSISIRIDKQLPRDSKSSAVSQSSENKSLVLNYSFDSKKDIPAKLLEKINSDINLAPFIKI